MQINNSTDWEGILDAFRKFVKQDILSVEKLLLEKDWEEALPILNDLRAKAKKQNLWLPQISKEYGGLGLTLPQFGAVSEILGASHYGHYSCNCQAPDAGNMEILIEFGTDEQKETYLKPLLNGDIRSCFAMTEPDFAGSNPVIMGTTASKANGQYLINGHKWFTTAADGAAFAIVMAISNPMAENAYKKASQIIVPLDTPGFQFVRNISIMGEVGGGWTSHAELRFENCKVPQSNILGEEGAGFSIAQKRLGPGRIHHCMRWIGICERVFSIMCERAATRKIGQNLVLGDKQTIQNWIAESRAEINAARLLVQDAAQKIEKDGAHKSKIDISIIKFYCANVLQKVVDNTVQVLGALGITDDTIVSYFYRHERGARIYDGADEVHKTRVAKQILKKYSK